MLTENRVSSDFLSRTADVPGFLGRRSADVIFDVDLSPSVFAAHISDFTKDGPLGPPSPVVTAETPEDAAVAIRIATIQGVSVIQLDENLQRIAGMRRPLQDLLSP